MKEEQKNWSYRRARFEFERLKNIKSDDLVKESIYYIYTEIGLDDIGVRGIVSAVIKVMCRYDYDIKNKFREKELIDLTFRKLSEILYEEKVRYNNSVFALEGSKKYHIMYKHTFEYGTKFLMARKLADRIGLEPCEYCFRGK